MSDLYIVQKIVGKRKTPQGNLYRVKWKDYSMEDCTWQPQQNLSYVKNLVKEYQAEQSGRKQKQMKRSTMRHEKIAYGEDGDNAKKQNKQQKKHGHRNPKEELLNEKQTFNDNEEDDRKSMGKFQDIVDQKLQEEDLNNIQYQSQATDDQDIVMPPQKNHNQDLYSPKQNKRKNSHLQRSNADADQQAKRQTYKQAHRNNTSRQIEVNPQAQRLNKINKNAKLNPALSAKPVTARKPSVPMILEMSIQQDTKQYIYMCKQEDLIVYRSREWMIKHHPEQLIKFYQHKIQFAKIPRISR